MISELLIIGLGALAIYEFYEILMLRKLLLRCDKVIDKQAKIIANITGDD